MFVRCIAFSISFNNIEHHLFYKSVEYVYMSVFASIVRLVFWYRYAFIGKQ